MSKAFFLALKFSLFWMRICRVISLVVVLKGFGMLPPFLMIRDSFSLILRPERRALFGLGGVLRLDLAAVIKVG